MGGRESQHLRVPLKRGNQPEGPRRGKEVPSHEPLKGNMPGTLRPEPCPRNDDGSRGSRIHEMRNRVRVMCKPGSVGGLGGRPPRSTRPPRFPALPTAGSAKKTFEGLLNSREPWPGGAFCPANEFGDLLGDRSMARDEPPRFRAMPRTNQTGVTTGLASPSFPYFAVEPLVFLRHVEVPEGIPLAIEVGGS